jgi:adenosine deaminase
VLRFMEPVDLFKNLIVAFISADSSPLMAGVNIVSPEDGETSMKDYWLQMVMFKYCHSRYPTVKYSMHAGELTLGLVQPEDLTWHIREAVYTAGAYRIGHGVDLAYEENPYELLRYMAKNSIAIEINLVSNEFILKVKEGRHPFSLYKSFGVPIVISTDDAGILRTNMTEQYVLLATRYKNVSYANIKQYVYNSIYYSFIKDESLKKQLLQDLELRFKAFEANFPLQ